MRKRRLPNRYTFCLLLITVGIMLPGKIARATTTELHREIEYETINKNEKKNFPESLEQDGNYILKNVTYDVIKEEPVTEKETVYIKKKSEVLAEDVEYSPEENITENGISYKLIQTDKKKKTIEQGYTQTVTGYSEYDSLESAKKAPATKNITVKEAKTGEDIVLKCKKTGVKKTASSWRDTYINITFVAYDSQYFLWNDVLVKKNEKEPLKGYHKELLESVGGNEKNYRILKINWKGGSYRNKRGILCRKARAYVQKKVPHYRVHYSATRKVKTVKGFSYYSTYAGEKTVSTGKVNYKILAKATYEMQEDEIPVMAITIGVVIAVLILTGILFLLVKKRKEKRKNIEQ